MMQLRRWTRIIFSAGILCLGIGDLAAQATRQSQDALDEARKDLEELPSTVTTPNSSSKSLDTGKLDLVIPSNGGSPNVPSTSTNPDNASQGWLLDALNKDQSSSTLSGLDRSKARVNARQGKLDTAASAETEKAWTPLLQAWLLPQNRALIPTLFGSSAQTRGQNDAVGNMTLPGVSGPGSFASASNHSNNSAVPAEWLTGDATYHDPLAQRTNPYLETNDTPTAGSTDFHIPRLTAPVSTSTSLTLRSTESSGDTDEGLYPTTGDSKATSRREELAPPTAPVVNQQKYFPQLDKF